MQLLACGEVPLPVEHPIRNRLRMSYERFLERLHLLIGQVTTELVPRDAGIVTQRDGGPHADALDAGETHRYLAHSVDV